LAVNNAKLAAHPRGSECLLAQNVIVVDDPKQVAKWQARSQSSPAEVAQGEAVEVVCITQGGCNVTWTATKELTPAGTALMSVNQHNRIVAAMAPPSPDAELVSLLSRSFAELEDWRMSFPDANSHDTDNILVDIDAKLASLRN
jgi:hypothetical protein